MRVTFGREPRTQVVVLLSYLKPGALLERVLGRVHYQVYFVVLCCRLDFLKRHRDIFFAGIEEPADTNDERADFARLVNENVHDLANLGIVRIIDVLFVPIGHDLRAAWYRRLQYL